MQMILIKLIKLENEVIDCGKCYRRLWLGFFCFEKTIISVYVFTILIG